MRTYETWIKPHYGSPVKLSVAAPTFLEAWKKVKAVAKKRREKYRIQSIVETATLDA